jgi:hypothetical protein
LNTRRALVRGLAWAAAWLPLGRRRLLAQEPALGDAERASLRALAALVLPAASLGAQGLDAALERFHAWLRAYREGAERDHGYGSPRLRWTPASPALRYPAQLAALDAQARERGAGSFARLPEPEQRELLEASLEALRLRQLPERPDGRHVATDLMAFFFRGSAANDLCYRARIGREDCRGLPGSEHAPQPAGEREP